MREKKLTTKTKPTEQKKVGVAPRLPGRPRSDAPVGDVTRTARGKTHLKRLDEAKGKRLVVDLDAPGRRALESLLDVGFGDSQKAVVIRALLSAEKEFCKKSL